MNNFEFGIKSYKNYQYYNPPEEVGLINQRLPQEILSKILNLSGDLSSAVAVNRLWRQASVSAKQTECAVIKSFAEFLGKNLKEEYASQIRMLLDIAGDRKVLNSVNIMEIKSSTHQVKERILNILKDLNEKDLKNLEALSNSKVEFNFFEKVFDLTRIYKKLDVANKINYNFTRAVNLWTISTELIQNGGIDKALKVANTISHAEIKEKTLDEIYKILTQNGDFANALKAANIQKK